MTDSFDFGNFTNLGYQSLISLIWTIPSNNAAVMNLFDIVMAIFALNRVICFSLDTIMSFRRSKRTYGRTLLSGVNQGDRLFILIDDVFFISELVYIYVVPADTYL